MAPSGNLTDKKGAWQEQDYSPFAPLAFFKITMLIYPMVAAAANDGDDDDGGDDDDDDDCDDSFVNTRTNNISGLPLLNKD